MIYHMLSYFMLYKMCLSPSTPEIKIKELTFLEIEEINLAKYSQKRKLTLPYVPYSPTSQHSFLSKLLASEVVSFASDSNGVLQAFSYLLFKNIYGGSLDEQLLKIVKMNLYKNQTDLAAIQGHPLGDLKCEEMKKFVVEFSFQLCFSDFNVQLQKKLHKHPVIITITMLFLRCLLAKLGLEEAKSYQQKLPYQTVVELLGDYLDLNFRKKGSAYLFIQTNTFLYDNGEQMLVGRYGQQPARPLPRHSNRTDVPAKDNTGKKGECRTSWHFGRKDSNYSSNDSHVSVEAPTPCFNTQQSSLQTSSRHTQGFAFVPTKNTASTEVNLQSANFGSIFQPQPTPNHYHISAPSIASIEEKLIFLDKQQNFIGSNRSSEVSIDKDFATQGDQCYCKTATRTKLSINSQLISMAIGPAAPRKNQPESFIFPKKPFKKENSKGQLFLQTERKKPFFSSISDNIRRTVVRTQESEQAGSPNPSLYSQPEYMSLTPQKISQPLNKTFAEAEKNSFYENKSSRSTSMFTTNFEEPLSFQRKVPQVKFFYKRQ